MRGGGAFREWRGLTEARAPRGLQLLAQSLVLASQPIAFTLRSLQLTSEVLVLINESLDPLLIRWRRPIAALAHAPLMPEFRRPYKLNPVTNYDLTYE